MRTGTTRCASMFALIVMTNCLIAGVTGRSIARSDSATSTVNGERLAAFEKRIDQLREELKIPALSAAIVKDQKVVWAKGFGYADLENKTPATEHTSYHLASLTKTFASTILMQLIQEGKVKLDDPVSKYGVTLESEGVIRVRHLFSHTSEGNPGEKYSYNGNRFAELDKVIRKGSGKTFGELLTSNIMEPLELNETTLNAAPLVKTHSPNGADPKAEAEVRAAFNELIGGFNSAKAETAERLVDPEHTSFTRDRGWLARFQDFNDLRAQFARGLRVNLEVTNLDCAVYGDTAVTTFMMNATVTPPGGRPAAEPAWRGSYVWNKQAGVWKIVHSHESPLEAPLITEAHRARFERVTKNLAQPYQLDNKSNIVKFKYPTHYSSSAGLISSVLDMAKYDIAIDQNRFVSKETQQLAFTPAVSTKGNKLPYGLGWFTQDYKGTRLIWHYGYWTCNSSLILKVPDRGITFIAMANTDNLSRPTDLGAGDVTSSPVGLAFLKTFVLPEIHGTEMPAIDWRAPEPGLKESLKAVLDKPYADVYRKELLVQARIYGSVGMNAESPRLFRVFASLYSNASAGPPRTGAIAQVADVVDDADRTSEFSLSAETAVRVFAVGEGDGGQLYDYGWIENAETGTPVWQMKYAETAHAGGAGKNRMVDAAITLPAGRYKLRYRSDESHSFDRWNALPPESNFWGIAVYPKAK